MQIRGLVGLCYYRSEIKSPVILNNRGKQWQDDEEKSKEIVIIYPGREARAASNGMEC